MYYKSIEDLEKAFYGNIDVGRLFAKSDDNVISGDTAQWAKVYGAKVWSFVNYEQNAFAVLPKEPWGKTGYRVETASGRTFPSGGIAEGATTTFTAVPDTIAGTYAYLAPPVKQVVHSWGVSDFADVYASVGDDSIPNAAHIETAAKAHGRALSAYLVQDTDTAAGAGFESLDRVPETYADSTTTYFNSANDTDIYGVDRSADTGGLYDGQTDANGLTDALLRDLTLTLIDKVWSDITKAGGKPKVLVTGYNTIRVWSSLLEAERRYDAFKMAQFVPRFGEASGLTGGEEVGFSVATYFGCPIIPCQDYDTSIATVRTNEVAPIVYLDTDFVRFAVAKPTSYTETDPANKISIGFGKKGWFETWGELRCYGFKFQGKLRDIK